MRKRMRGDGKRFSCMKRAMDLIRSCNWSEEAEVGFPSVSDDIAKRECEHRGIIGCPLFRIVTSFFIFSLSIQ